MMSTFLDGFTKTLAPSTVVMEILKQATLLILATTQYQARVVAALGKEFNLANDDIKAELTAKKKTDEEEE